MDHKQVAEAGTESLRYGVSLLIKHPTILQMIRARHAAGGT